MRGNIKNKEWLKNFLNDKTEEYNRPEFIENDPISIPHRFSLLQDIEISGFFAAILAWGQRKTIINKCSELMLRMDNAPYQFITNATDKELKRLEGFKHRTFNDTDLLYTIYFLQSHYLKHNSLETAFCPKNIHEWNIQKALTYFNNYFFTSQYAPQRTRKHIATPERKSACKRLNMYLRWLVRKDKKGVDFGIWNSLKPNQLMCPLDVHVDRTARALGLLQRKYSDWKAVEELTENLRTLDEDDPIKYDFALFGLSIEGKLK